MATFLNYVSSLLGHRPAAAKPESLTASQVADIKAIWAILSREVHVSIPDDIQKLSADLIGEKFHAWIWKYKVDLDKITLLRLSYEDLTHLPDILGELTHLKLLNLASNHFIRFPFPIVRLTNLDSLDLRSNSFRELPSTLGELTRLKNLNLESNLLEWVPSSLGQLSCLQTLNLRNNRLSSLPLPLADLPNTCTVYAENNHLSADQVLIFRNLGGPIYHLSVYEGPPVESVLLRETLSLWLDRFHDLFIKEVTLSPSSFGVLLRHPDHHNIHTFFRRLMETEDFQNLKTRSNLIFRAVRIIEGACRHDEFRMKMCSIIEHALSECSDRIAEYFNQIEIQWRIYCESTTLSDVDLAKLCIGLARIDLIEQMARQDHAEHIEIILRYKTGLSKPLHLPLTTQGMSFAPVAAISDAQIDQAKNHILAKTSSKEDVQTILLASDIWQERMEKLHAAAFQIINDDIVTRMEAESANKGLLIEEQKTRRKALLEELTDRWLSEHKDLVQ